VLGPGALPPARGRRAGSEPAPRSSTVRDLTTQGHPRWHKEKADGKGWGEPSQAISVRAVRIPLTSNARGTYSEEHAMFLRSRTETMLQSWPVALLLMLPYSFA